ncbi:ExeM/NucH family extracellular endonuclease [Demequina sediminis]
MHRRILAPGLIAALAVSTVVAVPAQAATTDLFISEYVEGSASNKAVEIYNGTADAVDLSAYTLELYSNGAATASVTTLAGTLAAGDVHVVVNGSAGAALAALGDQTGGATNFNGDDALILRHGETVIDSFGLVGVDPGTEWTGGGADDTLRRKATVCEGDTVTSDAFDVAVEWDSFAQDTFDGLGAHTSTCSGEPPVDVPPTVTSIVPADGAVGVLPGVAPVVTFSEPVAVDDAFALICGEDDLALTTTGGPTAYTVTPAAPLEANAECTFTVDAGRVTDVDGEPDLLAASASATFTVLGDPTPISAVQGATDTSPLAGQTVLIEGVVVGDYEGPSPALRGFYVQSRDADADADPATSEGIFVFNGNDDSVTLGDEVAVVGVVAEYQGQTQLGSVSSIEVLSHDAPVTPAQVSLPFAAATDAEAFEGMSVEFAQPLFVTEMYLLGRFGEVTVSGTARLDQPTAVVAPGDEANALQALNNLNKIKVDDSLNSQNPDPLVFGRGGQPLSASNTLRGGDTVTGLTGVMTYTWAGNSASGNAWRVRPAAELPDFEAVNERPTAAPEVGGDVKVSAFNVLNYFLTLDEGTPVCGPDGFEQDCRGAETPEELERQTAKLVAALEALDADVIGIMEMENSTGVEPLAALADALNEAIGSDDYSYVDTGVVGTDTIRVGFLYDTTAVAEVGDFAVLDSAVDPRFDDDRNRPSIAQTFEESATGETFTVVANHWKSKGSCAASGPDADQGDGASCWNATRTAGAEALVDWLGTDPTGVADEDVIIMGDLNSYGQEDPIQVLREAGYVELGGGDYSYVFDGQWGSLDYAFASSTMAEQVTDSAHLHINADEPSVLDYNTNFKSASQIESLFAPDMYRTSDHDPVLIGLDLTAPAAPEFTDVSADPASPLYSEHAEAIAWMAAEGISTGWVTEDGTEFRPLAHAKRDALAAFLYRAAGEPDFDMPAQSPFVDVSSDPSSPHYTEHWEAITWMAVTGLSQGYETAAGVEYRPLSRVTRDAVASFLYRANGEPEFDMPTEGPFVDVSADPASSVFSEHAVAIAWMGETGLSTGWETPAGAEFRPVSPITRDAIAAFLFRLDGLR